MIHIIRAALLAAVVALLQPVPAAMAQNPLPDLFQQGQQQFAAGEYEMSLATIEELDDLSRQPGLENDRRQLIAPIHFYRAANLAMLGRTEDAITQFQGFLHRNPGAALEKGTFPEPVIAAFDKARSRMRGGGDIGGVYAAYRSVAPTDPLPVSARWAETPVRRLMTADEKRQWNGLRGDAERQEFVEAFWKRRDPTPDTSVNELRRELETRIRFADDRWTDDERRGGETDLALVFALLGPPSFINVSQIESEEDTIEQLRGEMTATGTERNPLRTNLARGRRETWTYRDQRVPDDIQMRELRFDFQTKEGYGAGVLDKQGRSLFALGEVAKRANETGELN